TVARAEGVVLLSLLGIGEHVVRALDLLEALLGGLVPGVLVRVVLARELPVRLLELVRGGVLSDAEHLVEVLTRRRRHSSPSPPRPRPVRAAARGRPACSPSAGRRGPRPRRPRTAARAAPRGRAGRSCR